MNTRLQVEHPVTELVTGIDLVEQMIRVAAGETLAIRQEDVTLSGWAVESRIYAEDPYRNFLPSTGRLVTYRPPPEISGGITVRNDTGVYEGGEISIWYDPMIAKLVTHAATRGEAIAAQADALDAFAIEGIRHNIPFLAAVMQQPRFQARKALDRLHRRGISGRLSSDRADGRDRAGACRRRRRHRPCAGRTEAQHLRPDDRPSGTRERRRAVWLGETEIALDVAREDGGIAVQFAERRGGASSFSRRTGSPAIRSGAARSTARRSPCRCGRGSTGFALSHRGVETTAFVYTEREAAAARLMPVKKAADTGKRLLCPMPGLVVSIAVAEGQEVKAGETLAVVEAMKMENVLRAERDGTVKAIRVKPGDSLAVDAVIMEFA